MKRELKKYYKELIDNITINDEQIEYLIDLYKDKNCIIGLHKTPFSYDSFFKSGLYNQTDLNENTKELANTIYYSRLLFTLLGYPDNTNENVKFKTCIVLKIPNNVLQQKQGIIETDNEGRDVIPKEFIVGAFQAGRIYENPNFNESYINNNAILCDDKMDCDFDRNQQINYYRELTKEKGLKSILSKIRSFFENKFKNIKAIEEKSATSEEQEKKELCEHVGEPNIGDRSRFLENKETEIDITRDR